MRGGYEIAWRKVRMSLRRSRTKFALFLIRFGYPSQFHYSKAEITRGGSFWKNFAPKFPDALETYLSTDLAFHFALNLVAPYSGQKLMKILLFDWLQPNIFLKFPVIEALVSSSRFMKNSNSGATSSNAERKKGSILVGKEASLKIRKLKWQHVVSNIIGYKSWV